MTALERIVLAATELDPARRLQLADLVEQLAQLDADALALLHQQLATTAPRRGRRRQHGARP